MRLNTMLTSMASLTHTAKGNRSRPITIRFTPLVMALWEKELAAHPHAKQTGLLNAALERGLAHRKGKREAGL